MRRRLHDRISNAGLRAILTRPYQGRAIGQWNVYCIYMLFVSILFIERIAAAFDGMDIIYVALGLLITALIIVMWRIGTYRAHAKSTLSNAQQGKVGY